MTIRGNIDIYNEDCIAHMQSMPENSVDLVVTSPPYDNLRTYNDGSEWNFDVFTAVADNLFRVVK